ncbi:Molybdate transporter 1/2 [Dillenia turbinata]|uniref:Molybdate transporter 1/2 n=1 Tax=Dillenia turbinata TaxID=194707 RepID=A0AAN8V651_9MAGN
MGDLGIYNFGTGALYGIPMPVQPMKAISAVAISSGPGFGIPEVMFAGIWTGVILLLLGVTVCKLSSDLFPGRRFTSTSLSVTVGVMNLVGCWFGAMPCCHGAGGLAGQYKFGGRSGGCVALLGVAKLVLGLALGSSIVKVLDQFPVGVLGVLLLFAGIELAMAARDMNSKEEAFVMLVCAAVSLVGSGASAGFACGIVAHLLLQLRKV